MQTAVGFVRSLYDNENHYRITWGFRTWEQQGGERRATLGLINGLWRCPSGPLWLFLPALLSTLVLYHLSFIPLLCSTVGQCKSEPACSERLTECKPISPLWRKERGLETGGGVYDLKQGLCLTWQTPSSHLLVLNGRRVGSYWPLASETVGQLRVCELA